MAPIRSGLSSFDSIYNRLNFSLEIFETAVVLNHIVRESTFFRQAHLRVDVLLRNFNTETVAFLQASFLNIEVAGNQDHGAKPFMQVAFKKQRHLINYDLIARCRVLLDTLLGQGAHARMDNRFEFLSRSGVVEDGRAQLLPIESLVGLQNFGAERLDDVFPGVVSRFDDFPRQRVGVDDRSTQTFQDFRNRAFPRCDATR